MSVLLLNRSNLGAVGHVAVEEDDPTCWNDGWFAWFSCIAEKTMREIVVHFLDLDLELDKSMVQFDVREDKREIAGTFRGFISGEEGVV